MKQSCKYSITQSDQRLNHDIMKFSNYRSLHHIMLIDLSKMKQPLYLSDINEHIWRASVRQQSQPNPPNFFRDIMDEYEKVTGAISISYFKFYKLYFNSILFSLNITSSAIYGRTHSKRWGSANHVILRKSQFNIIG